MNNSKLEELLEELPSELLDSLDGSEESKVPLEELCVSCSHAKAVKGSITQKRAIIILFKNFIMSPPKIILIAFKIS